MTGADPFLDIVRRILSNLDAAIYSLVPTLYNLFAYIAQLSIFDENALSDFRTRVYVILGIVMLFKIAFSLITLLANPDDLTDSKKGITGIVKRIIIALLLITLVQPAFETSRRIQKYVIEDNIIGQFFLGELDEGESQEILDNSGDLVAFSVLRAFYYPEPSLTTIEGTDCVTGDKKSMPTVDNDTNGGNSRSIHVMEEHMDKCDASDGAMNGPEKFYYVTHHSYDVVDYLSQYINEEADISGDGSGTGAYAMHYDWLISTIAGVVVAWLFLGFCVDTAIRAVKLGVLELIAPVPIFSYIDPKKGDSVFQNWIKTTISTYLSLFGRLLLVFFVLYIVHVFESSGFKIADASGKLRPLTDDSIMSYVARAFIYIGLLLFAKDAPKLFSEMFGIKLESSFGMKVAKMGIAGTALGAALGTTKLTSGLVRRHVEKSGERSQLRAERDALLNGRRAADLDEEEAERYNALNAQIRSSYAPTLEGAKQIGRGVWMGVSRGGLTGARAGKVDLSTYRSSRSAANAKQKLRENGVSFTGEQVEKYMQNAGVSGKYGDFGRYQNELRDLQNQKRDADVMERRMRENYIDELNKISNESDIIASHQTDLTNMLRDGDAKGLDALRNQLIQERQTALYAQYDQPDLSDAARTQLSKDSAEAATKEMNELIDKLEKRYRAVKTWDTLGQKLEKDINNRQKNIDAISNIGKK